MSATDFVAGPVHIDGQQLYFFVELKHPQAPLEVLAAAYTAVFMRENADELAFSAYQQRHTRLSEDDWYDIAKHRFDLHMAALQQDPSVLRDVRDVVEQKYFGSRVPAEVYPLLTKAAVVAYQGAPHAA